MSLSEVFSQDVLAKVASNPSPINPFSSGRRILTASSLDREVRGGLEVAAGAIVGGVVGAAFTIMAPITIPGTIAAGVIVAFAGVGAEYGHLIREAVLDPKPRQSCNFAARSPVGADGSECGDCPG